MFIEDLILLVRIMKFSFFNFVEWWRVYGMDQRWRLWWGEGGGEVIMDAQHTCAVLTQLEHSGNAPGGDVSMVVKYLGSMIVQ